MLKLDLTQTVAFAGLILFLGYGIRRYVRPLARHNIPAPVIGGLLAAAVITILRTTGLGQPQFDTALQAPLMIAFFTSIGFGASVSLLRSGGPQVLMILALATVVSAMQSALGMAIAAPLGVHPLIGVLAGSVTLAGGPATGLAFAPDFEAVGVGSAATIAVASAMVGIIMAGLVGGPISTWLIERNRLGVPGRAQAAADEKYATDESEGSGALTGRAEAAAVPAASADLASRSAAAPTAFDGLATSPAASVTEVTRATPTAPAAQAVSEPAPDSTYLLLKTVVIILAVMWLGSWLSLGMTSIGIKLPAYIGAMLVAAIVRNLDEATHWFGLSHHSIREVGGVALALFISMALMTLKLWELVGLAVPLLVILAAQVVMIGLICLAVFRIMGRDYEAAVMTGGFCGFMLGTTANAVANMEALVEKYGPAPRAFLAVPMVGAFFIDFSNALIITTIVNFWR